MTKHHIYWLAGAAGLATGFFFLTGANAYGAGRWGQSTLGAIYNQGAVLGTTL